MQTHIYKATYPFLLMIVIAGCLALGAPLNAVAGKKNPDIEVQVLAPGWGNLKYDPPVAGSYDLTAIRKAPSGGDILLSTGQAAKLSDYFDDKLTVLAFIYTSCNDVNGCPLATFVLHSLQKSLAKRADLRNKVRFISMSFDPQNDTPESLREYASEFDNTEGHEWLFATTESDEKLRPILEGYGQYTFKVKDEDGKTAIAHILRAFLIDREGYIRNIYSVDFLHPQILLADIETLLLERNKVGEANSTQ